MKKLFGILSLAALFAFGACDDKGKGEKPGGGGDDTITIEDDQLDHTVSAAATTATIEFSTNNTWTAEFENEVDWLRFSPKSGAAGDITIDVDVDANPAEATRKAVIFITTDNQAFTKVTITQQAKGTLPTDNIEIADAQRNQTIEATALSAEIDFTTTGAWTAAFQESVAWMSFDPKNGNAAGNHKIEVTTAANMTTAPRSGVILISCGEATVRVTITQKAGEMQDTGGIKVENNKFVHDADPMGDEIEINFKSPDTWNAILVTELIPLSAGAPDPWITFGPKDGPEGDNTITVTAAENPTDQLRQGTIRITSGTSIVNVLIMQAAGPGAIEEYTIEADDITLYDPADGVVDVAVIANDGLDTTIATAAYGNAEFSLTLGVPANSLISKLSDFIEAGITISDPNAKGLNTFSSVYGLDGSGEIVYSFQYISDDEVYYGMCYFVDRDVTVTGTYTPTDTKGTKVIYDLDLTRGWNLVYYREDMEGDMLLDGYYTTLPASAGDMSWIGHTW